MFPDTERWAPSSLSNRFRDAEIERSAYNCELCRKELTVLIKTTCY